MILWVTVTDGQVDKIIKAILIQGSTRWYPIGLQLGLNDSQIRSTVNGIALDHDKLRAIIEWTRIQMKDEIVVRKLLDACSDIVLPIRGAVQDELQKLGEVMLLNNLNLLIIYQSYMLS